MNANQALLHVTAIYTLETLRSNPNATDQQCMDLALAISNLELSDRDRALTSDIVDTLDNEVNAAATWLQSQAA